MTSPKEIRTRFLEFFKAPPRSHAVIPSASLVPENDPTTLFTGSGMQPLIPYLLGEPHPLGARLADSEKCFRAEDIDEVGDNRHTTFFEMLGNWSLGDYWKEEQLPWLFEFLTDGDRGAGLDPARLYATVFSGGDGVARDEDSIGIWKKIFSAHDINAAYAEMGTEEEGAARGMKEGERIFGYGVRKNWWSRSGIPSKMPAGEPGGPDSEVFYDFDPMGVMHDAGKYGTHCHPNCDCGRFLEIGNSVFMEFRKKEDGGFEKLPRRNVDFGGGLERITAAANGRPDIFDIDTFDEVKKILEISTKKRYADQPKEFRIILDHVRAAVFIIADGVSPSNTGRGYVLRRLLRRAIRFADKLNANDLVITNGGARKDFYLNTTVIMDAAEWFIKAYTGAFVLDRNEILPVVKKEEEQFRATLARGLKEFERWYAEPDQEAQKRMPGLVAFNLFTTFGFPLELIIEIANERGVGVDIVGPQGFKELMKQHQELSRTSSAGMFKGGLADHSEKTTRLHTAHHLLLRALQAVLGPQVKQRGSNITSERLRMDFSYDGKMTDEEKRETERIVNEKIAEDLPVIRSEMAREDAEKIGAEHEFGQKYPDRVSVYSVGPKGATPQDPRIAEAFSIEFCGGPHVAHTGEIGHFRIVKEEAVGQGIRRIRGVLE